MRRLVALALLLPLLAPGSASAANGDLAQYGYHLYGAYCLSCHGGNAQGRSNARGNSTGFGPGRVQDTQMGLGPSLQGVGALAADFYLRMGYMPLERNGMQPTHRTRPLFGEQQIRALVAYVAGFGGPPIPRPNPSAGSLSQGQELFAEHCAGCHQIVAKGGYVTGGLPPPLDRVNARQVAEAVRIGPYLMPKFTEKAISDTELDSIVRYVEYAKHPDSPGGAGIGYLGPVPEGLVTWFVALPLLLVLCLFLGRRLSS